MGRYKVAMRWLAISMASSLGRSSSSDVGCHLATMIANIDVARCGARGGQPRAHVAAWMELRRVCGWNYVEGSCLVLVIE